MYAESKCKKCRRAGEKLFLKGDRCFTPKCAFEKKPYTPGMVMAQRKHRAMLSEYGIQLKEKQKLRNAYGLSEKQFVKYVREATTQKEVAPIEKLYEMLERRLDNTVYRMGIAKSRATARQIVSHGHVYVNGRRVDVPSYIIRKGDEIQIRKESQESPLFEDSKSGKGSDTAPWVAFDVKKLSGKVNALPSLAKETKTFNYISVIEYYSR